MTCGVYEIAQRGTVRRYVGSSSNVEGRWTTHLCLLRAENHHCAFLQRVWSKYGEGCFEFRLLEECSEESLAEREQFHMDSTVKEGLLNSQPNARTCRGYRLKQETKDKIAEAARRVASDPEERRRRSERAKAQHASGSLGKSSKKTKAAQSQGLKRAWAEGKFSRTVEATRERMKVTPAEEMSRRSYQRNLFKETETNQ